MKILYHIPFQYGLGADRWIYEGFQDAFRELGHNVSTYEHHEDLACKLAEQTPDFVITSQNDLLLLPSRSLEALAAFRRSGGRVFARVGEDFAATPRHIALLQNRDWCDLYFTSYSDRVMRGFRDVAERDYVHIPFAANSRTHFPAPPSPAYECDICFVGANLPRKRAAFRTLLLPLIKKYRVRVFGPGWTMKDKMLAAFARMSRKVGFSRAAEAFSKMRVTLPAEEERTLYSSAKICLNIHEYRQDGGILGLSNEREFKIPAAGGFQVSDDCPGLEQFFTPGKEIVIARHPEEWLAHVAYYLTHDAERRAIQEAGTRRALRDHTYIHRAREIIARAAR